ncbi:NAD(P)-dependent oxidoreductase [Agrococcus sp. SGAir0287]|uniref:NAD(P)-dependent oxidoreductase n=1 Tax=Agrococcus sp. SGAir0287 TaxID=2070347 RepID=UPI0010CD3AD1|nr:NAD(P)-dependent oxidoreductase [Agrococcus sp. SGAir0287]QCR19963.1 phosphoglycerate dehydrogenase [Agrococcus sp. SGAir0287]
MKVLVPTIVDGLDALEGAQVVRFDPAAPIPDEHLDADVLVGWGLGDAQLADAATRLRSLRMVQLLSAGSDAALAAGFAPGVAICSGRSLHDRPVAEHALALILAAARRLHTLVRAQLEHRWASELGGIQPEPSPGVFTTLRDARVTIWGYGSIGSTLAPHLQALGAHVTGAATRARTEGDVEVVDRDALPALLERTDVLVMILPATDATRHALDATMLAHLPRHAWVVNVGRGATVDEAALVAALEADALGGAALDVTEVEPLPASSPLWERDDVILTPHAAGGRPLGAASLVAANVAALANGDPLANLVQVVGD